ncbi:hypothetical protein [Streptomyces sp. NPDC046887]|uniref:hypothetical protein n=1 Tax=Streptomyces sp. NPDC046887 TaxID=3155472 RepID=UPI0033EA113A
MYGEVFSSNEELRDALRAADIECRDPTLVANDVCHAEDGTICVAAIRISVVKAVSARQPVMGTPGPDADRGRCLLLVEALSDQWGSDLEVKAT